MKVIICRGIQGSGKTYWAKQWVNQNPVGRIRVK
jgi:predicted alpha/beta hydrolase family esterase